MKKGILAVCTLLIATAAGYAQQASSLQSFGGTVDERGSTRIALYDQARQAVVGEYAINYGRPVWKAEYAQQIDQMTEGKTWRLGNNFWTTLDTNLPLELAGVKVPVGSYYLAVRRSADGSNWKLAFLNPEAVRQHRIDAFDVSKAPVAFTAPLKFSKTEKNAQKLTIVLDRDKAHPGQGQLLIEWGNLQLSAPVKAQLM